MATSVWLLWLPILVSGVALFFASWLAWMVIGHHKNDWQGLPNEQAIVDAIRSTNVGPGQYMFPHCPNPEDWKSGAHQERMKAGPNGVLYVWKPGGGMGANLVCTWLLFTVLSFIIAYLAGIALPPGAAFKEVFRFISTAGILTYASSGLLNAIWFKRKVLADIADGIAYGLLTGLVFALLWPAG